MCLSRVPHVKSHRCGSYFSNTACTWKIEVIRFLNPEDNLVSIAQITGLNLVRGNGPQTTNRFWQASSRSCSGLTICIYCTTRAWSSSSRTTLAYPKGRFVVHHTHDIERLVVLNYELWVLKLLPGSVARSSGSLPIFVENATGKYCRTLIQTTSGNCLLPLSCKVGLIKMYL